MHSIVCDLVFSHCRRHGGEFLKDVDALIRRRRWRRAAGLHNNAIVERTSYSQKWGMRGKEREKNNQPDYVGKKEIDR